MRTIDDILPTLVDATNSGKLDWRQGDIDDGYSVPIGPVFTFLVWHWFDDIEETSGFTAQLRKGTIVVDALRATQYSPKFGALEAVHEAARRSYYNVDEAIGEVEGELAKLLK